MIKETKAEALAQVFAALASADRLRIMRLLARENRPNCGDVAQALGLSAPSVSYHLRILENAGLIQRVRRGQERCVLLTPRLQELVRPEVLHQL